MIGDSTGKGPYKDDSEYFRDNPDMVVFSNDYGIPMEKPVTQVADKSKVDPYGGDRTRGIEPPRDPLEPLFDPNLVLETDVPNMKLFPKGVDPDLVIKPDTGENPTEQLQMAPPYRGEPKGKDAPLRPGTPKERLTDASPDPVQAGQQYAQAAGHENLGILEKGFLKLLRGAEEMGAGGTAVKLYNDVMQRGRTKTITEEDFMPGDIERMKALVEAKIEKTGKSSGRIGYPDYKEMPRSNQEMWPDGVALGLGGFQFSKDEKGDIHIKDIYDFNADRGSPHDDNLALQLESTALFPMGLAAHIGRKLLPDTSGRGLPVEIKIRNKK